MSAAGGCFGACLKSYGNVTSIAWRRPRQMGHGDLPTKSVRPGQRGYAVVPQFLHGRLQFVGRGGQRAACIYCIRNKVVYQSSRVCVTLFGGVWRGRPER